VNKRILPLMVLLLAAPTPAAAEIIDKMPTIPEMWIKSLVAAGIIVTVFLWKRWLAVGLWLSASALHLIGLLDWNEPSFSDAIVSELGEDYLLHAFGAALVVWCLPLAWAISKGRSSVSAADTTKQEP
jgi:hypothetical protein